MTVTLDAAVETEHANRTENAGASRAGLLAACLYALIAANVVQVAAAFANAEPRPPAEVVPGIAAIAVLGIAALALLRSGNRSGYWVGIVFCAASMVGMGLTSSFWKTAPSSRRWRWWDSALL